MLAHSPQRRPATGTFVLAPFVILLLAGCDQVPAPANDDPEPPPPAASPPPVNVTPVVARTPGQIVDEFLATPPNLRTDDQLRLLSELEEGLERITDLDLRQSSVTDAGAAVLPKFTAITRLNLSGSRVTSAVTPHLATMAGLEELFLNNLPLPDESIEPLSELPALRSLSLSGTGVSEECFRHLAECEALESLTLDSNERLLGNGFSEMLRRGEFATLRELSVNRTGFGFHGFRELNRLSQLESLRASHAEVMDPELDGIRSCTTLRTLNLGNNKLSDAGLERLTRLRELEELDVSGCLAITDAGLARLRALDQLQRLSLEGTSCSLAGATDLKERFLENTTILVANQEL